MALSVVIPASAQATTSEERGADRANQARGERVTNAERERRDQMEPGFPRKSRLAEPAEDTTDASLPVGAAPYHELARRLNEAQVASEYVSVEVMGTTSTGREMYLVTLTAPETSAAATRQAELKQLMVSDPAAATERDLASYKAPVFINTNLHGDEREGTGAALTLVEQVAAGEDPELQSQLSQSRLHLVISANPDGRFSNSRANTNGFDLNRDFITGSQAETRAVRDAIIDIQPLMLLDLHGYVNGTLIEPTTAPFGEAYEHDLLLKHSYANALAMESAIEELGYSPYVDGVDEPRIPLRDEDGGWDGWPPIFTPQYGAYHGAIAQTVELPLRVNNDAYDELPTEELERRTTINRDIAQTAIATTTNYAVAHRQELLADQIEIFRRGVAGEDQQQPAEEDLPGVDLPEVTTTDYPRAYVIPQDQGQRSAVASARLINHLRDNGISVHRTSSPVTIGGSEIEAGAYLVDMQQAKRGLAQTMLSDGTDITDQADSMYDIAGWSLGLLWGAVVFTLEQGEKLPSLEAQPVNRADAPGSLPSATSNLELVLKDPRDVRALTSLLDAGVRPTFTPSGSVLVDAADRKAAKRVADDYGVSWQRASTAEGTTIGPDFTVAAAAESTDVWALESMGLDVDEIDTDALNDGYDWSQVDALYASADLTWSELTEQARAEVSKFLTGGGGLVAQGEAGAALNSSADLLQASAHSASEDANGVLEVDTANTVISEHSPSHTFGYEPVWFTDLGANVTAEQTLVNEPLVAGFWERSGTSSADKDAQGWEAAQQNAAVVSGQTDDGARVALFGTDPLFRAHPKGQFASVARALFWSAQN